MPAVGAGSRPGSEFSSWNIWRISEGLHPEGPGWVQRLCMWSPGWGPPAAGGGRPHPRGPEPLGAQLRGTAVFRAVTGGTAQIKGPADVGERANGADTARAAAVTAGLDARARL